MTIMFKRKSKDKTAKASSSGGVKPLDVALIGCGPAGMMFLHALNKKRKSGSSDQSSSLPNVTCFERAASPGGIWRDLPEDDKGRTKPENVPVMYDDLWSNIPKELMEFYDYTFDDHFKNKPTPSFLPRKDLLEYILARNSVDGALDNVKFSHTVQSVKYDGQSEKFDVTVRDDSSGAVTTTKFDRCIWAAGLHGAAEKPDDVMEVLKEFTGKVLHSIEAVENFEADVKGKKVMLIGDSYSAEDLALRAVKLGAEHVYVTARSGEGVASETKCWPDEKVTVIYGPPYKVMKGTTFKCQAVYWSEKKQKFRRDDDEEPVKVKDIDTVVLCTGYDCPSLSILDESLQFDDEGEWEISKGWAMDNNALTISIGSPKPSKNLGVGATCYPDVYRGLLISNPRMMFIHETEDPVSPVLELDVLAHLILAYLTGEAEIPKEKDMLKANQKQLEAEMNIPWLRLSMDPAYADEINDLEDHWSENHEDERVITLNRLTETFRVQRIARDMKSAKYPVDLGDHKRLSQLGDKMVDMVLAMTKCRTELPKSTPEGKWMTFRDTVRPEFASLYTSTAPCGLPGHWLDLNTEKGEPCKLENMK